MPPSGCAARTISMPPGADAPTRGVNRLMRALNIQRLRAGFVIGFLVAWMSIISPSCQTALNLSTKSGDWLARFVSPAAAKGPTTVGRLQDIPLALPYASYAEEKPRLIPLVAAESGYSENSSVNLLCTVSQGHHETLTFDWFKDGQLLAGSNQEHRASTKADTLNESPVGGLTNQASIPQIEKNTDHSLLRISRVQAHHSGRYTCAAKNQFGQDSTSVVLLVNVKMRWTKEPPAEVVVSIDHELKVDCLAQGQPRPMMRWEKLDASIPMLSKFRSTDNHHNPLSLVSLSMTNNASDTMSKRQLVATNSNGYKLAQRQQNRSLEASGNLQSSVLVSSNRHLSIARAKESDAGIYECIASNSHDIDLRKLVHVQVRGSPRLLPISSAESYPEGSSINLVCTVSAGQREGLSIRWQINGKDLEMGQKQKYSKLEMDNVFINTDETDISFLRIKNATHANSATYTCIATNPLGQDTTSVKIVINVDLKWQKVPQDVEVGLNQEEIEIECSAVGSPEPTVEWYRHPDIRGSPSSNGTILVARGKWLKFARAHHRDAGLYECLIRQTSEKELRKIIQVKVRGK